MNFFFFWCYFERALSTSFCVTSIAQGRMRQLENKKSGDFSGQTLTSCSWGYRSLCLAWGSALGLLLFCSSSKNCQKLRQLDLNTHLNFPLSLRPWYSSALAALPDTLEQRNIHCGVILNTLTCA